MLFSLTLYAFLVRAFLEFLVHIQDISILAHMGTPANNTVTVSAVLVADEPRVWRNPLQQQLAEEEQSETDEGSWYLQREEDEREQERAVSELRCSELESELEVSRETLTNGDQDRWFSPDEMRAMMERVRVLEEALQKEKEASQKEQTSTKKGNRRRLAVAMAAAAASLAH